MLTVARVELDIGLWLPFYEGLQQAALSVLLRRVVIGRVREYSIKHIPAPLGIGLINVLYMASPGAEYKEKLETSLTHRVVLNDGAAVSRFMHAQSVPRGGRAAGLQFGSARMIKPHGSIRFTPPPLIVD